MASSLLSPTTTSCSEGPSRSDARLTIGWDREWQRLTRDRAACARPLAWAAEHPRLAAYEDLDALVHDTGRGLPDDEADSLLAAVVEHAATDEVAAHVVLRRILPALVTAAVRRGASGQWRVRPLFDDLTATAWVLIRTYPLERRPRRIAVNLVRDAEYHVCVRPFRLRSGSELPADPHGATLDAAPMSAGLDGRSLGRARHAGDELAAVLTEGRRAGLVDEVALLGALYLEGEAVGAAAARLGVSPRTVLSRRIAATNRLREVAA